MMRRYRSAKDRGREFPLTRLYRVMESSRSGDAMVSHPKRDAEEAVALDLGCFGVFFVMQVFLRDL
jgi:hypothetical protein